MNILLYSHDTYGLGHIRRTLALANSMRGKGRNVIIITGSPFAGKFEYPCGIDYIRIPGMTKFGNDLYRPTAITVTSKKTVSIRQNIILATAKTFKPSLFIVDKAPLGMAKEVLPTLRWLHKHTPEAKLVLGLRDIMDSSESTIRDWTKKNIYEVMEDLYSEIWVYGDRQIYDSVQEYHIPPQVAEKVHFTGYIPRHFPSRNSRPRVRKSMGISQGERFVLVTTGGGGDGYKVIDTYLRMLESKEEPGVKTMLITGPFLAEAAYDELAVRARRVKARICKFYRKIERAIFAADCVVSMGGYNTCCEIICAARPSLVIPRNTPREEQMIRARLLADRGLLDYIPWETVEPEGMREKIHLLLDQGTRYEEQLRAFPMTAYDVIGQRLASFGKPA
ncbi:MAG: glycosyltransferase [Desulfobulbaceae bacterium]|nr:MAG: glycosyltransferase [Desulfobulbaceae bacterium]